MRREVEDYAAAAGQGKEVELEADSFYQKVLIKF